MSFAAWWPFLKRHATADSALHAMKKRLTPRHPFHVAAIVAINVAMLAVTAGAQNAPTSQPSAESVSLENQPFDPAEKLFGDPWKFRSLLDKKGVSIDPLLIVD